MRSKGAYSSWFSDDAVTFFSSLTKAKRRKVLDIADTLAAHPFSLGDFQSTDEAGHVIETILVDEFIFSYWVDHGAREVRITEIVQP
jgi:hypothetical protein